MLLRFAIHATKGSYYLPFVPAAISYWQTNQTSIQTGQSMPGILLPTSRASLGRFLGGGRTDVGKRNTVEQPKRAEMVKLGFLKNYWEPRSQNLCMHPP